MTYDTSVFVNCPFDTEYRPILQALTFAIQDCGFLVKTALGTNDSGETRLRKIEDMIRDCRYSVHDLCRVEADTKVGQLPRFNMPFEMGLAFGANAYGDAKQKTKAMLILDSEPYRFRAVLSDISGQDPSPHENKPKLAIDAVRRFLASQAPPGASLPGTDALDTRFKACLKALPAMAKKNHITMKELNRFEYWADLAQAMYQWQEANPR